VNAKDHRLSKLPPQKQLDELQRDFEKILHKLRREGTRISDLVKKHPEVRFDKHFMQARLPWTLDKLNALNSLVNRIHERKK